MPDGLKVSFFCGLDRMKVGKRSSSEPIISHPGFVHFDGSGSWEVNVTLHTLGFLFYRDTLPSMDLPTGP